MTITPLETRYAGCRFRSRLEARWAVFFDKLGIKWEYEPQGYTVGPSRRAYLPDFRLPELQTFVEVKGEAERLDIDLLVDLTRYGEEPYTVVLGNVPAMEVGRIPTHTLFMKSGDYADGREGSCVPRVNKAFAAMDGLDETGRAAVMDLIRHESRMRVLCQPSFLIGSKDGWAFMPIGPSNLVHTAEAILNPRPWWPILPQPKLQAAYDAARSARFEHGERG